MIKKIISSRIRTILKNLCLVILVLLTNTTSFAQTKVSSLFDNDMVLQQKERVKIWGTDKPNEEVKIKGSWGEKEVTKTNKHGKWYANLQTPSAGGPYKLRVEGSEEIILSDIFIGEVWLLSGQSNMAMPLEGLKNQPVEGSKEAILNSTSSQIRFFNVEKNASLKPLSEVQGSWKKTTPETTGKLSAAGYFFGRKLEDSLDVPVGLIVSAWGGSVIEAWMNKRTLNKFKNIEIPDKLPEKQSQKEPTLLYNAMLHPLIGFNVKGIVWYQGEANRYNPKEYKSFFPSMIKLWRKKWQKENLPFYFAQIAPFEYSSVNSALVREAQLKTAQQVEHTGMAVTLDVGDCKVLHPAKKREVGERLALWALSKDYNMSSIAYSGPLYENMTVTENQRVQLYFSHVYGGLTSMDKELTGFSIAGKDNKFYSANAEITNDNTVHVWADEIEEPVAVRYAFENCPEATLFNGAGLPASSFSTNGFSESKK